MIDVSTGTVDRALVAEPSTWRRYLPNMGQSRGQWLGPEVAAAVRANGEIYLVRGDEYEIDVLSPEGRLVRRIRASVERTPVDARDLEDWIQSSRYSFGDDEVRELGPPDLKPIAGRLLVAPSGRLLMNRRDLSSLRNADPETFFETWDLVGANGRVEGRFNVDASTYLRVLTDSMVYAIVRDALDVQYIVGYRIVPTGD